MVRHKVSELVSKIKSLNTLADMLYDKKYVNKCSKAEIDHIIDQIRADCYLICNDRQEYERNEQD